MQPGRTIRDTAIVGIVLIDSQIDHTTGLLMLREGKPLDVYCTEMVRQDLTTGNPLFNILGHYCGVNWHPIPVRPARLLRYAAPRPYTSPLCPCTAKRPHIPRIGRRRRWAIILALRVEDAHTGKRLFYAPGSERSKPISCPIWRSATAC